MYMNIVLEQERLLHAHGVYDRIGRLPLADIDAARECACVAVDTVIGNLQIVRPAVCEDTAAALRAVGDGDPVDSRWIAPEVAWEGLAIVVASSQRARAGWEVSFRPGRSSAVLADTLVLALRQHRDSGTFIGTHQRGFLEQLREIAVQSGVPAYDAFERQRIHCTLHGGGARVLTRGVVGVAIVQQAAIEGQAEQAVHPATPWIPFARGMCIGIDGRRRGTRALQPYRLPHQQHLVVDAWAHHDQVTWARRVDRCLNSVARGVLPGDVGGSSAPYRDRHRVDRLLAAARGDDEF